MNIFRDKTKTGLLILISAIVVPSVALAQTIQDVLAAFLDVLLATIPVIMGLSVVYFLWGLSKYVLKADDVEGKKAARSIMLWGIIILFVMVSLWGFVNLLNDSFGLKSGLPAPPLLFEA